MYAYVLVTLACSLHLQQYSPPLVSVIVSRGEGGLVVEPYCAARGCMHPRVVQVFARVHRERAIAMGKFWFKRVVQHVDPIKSSPTRHSMSMVFRERRVPWAFCAHRDLYNAREPNEIRDGLCA